MPLNPVSRRGRWPRFAAAALALGASVAAAAADCPPAAEVLPRQLLGLWRAELDGGAAATLLLEPHREYVQSLSGEINRNGERSRLAADVEDGEFTMEESADGKRISASWIGEVVDGSCGREIQGTFRPEGGAERRFRLRRIDPSPAANIPR